MSKYSTDELLSQTSRSEPVSRDGDVTFVHEAIPWLDDVHRFALSLTRDQSDAEDVVQDTFFRAFRSWHTYRPGSDCRRWLFTICRNVFLRSRERDRPTVALDSTDVDVAAIGGIPVTGATEGLDDMLARLDVALAISRALAAVPEPYRSTLIVVDMEDQSYETAATRLRIPTGTVRSRLSRGRRLMQKQLLTYASDAGFGHPSTMLAAT